MEIGNAEKICRDLRAVKTEERGEGSVKTDGDMNEERPRLDTGQVHPTQPHSIQSLAIGAN